MEGYDRKSLKEESFMAKNIILMILNSLILPLIINTMIVSITDKEQ